MLPKDNPNAMQFGDGNTGEKTDGMRVIGTVDNTIINPVLAAATGQVEIVQTVRINNQSSAPSGVYSMSSSGNYVLDGWPPKVGVATTAPISAAGSGAKVAKVPYASGGDSPNALTSLTINGSPLNFNSVSADESFIDYLMYQPVGGIWVTLETVSWTWGGLAKLDKATGWQIQNPHSTQGTIQGIPSVVLPEWTTTGRLILDNPKKTG
jgi:hypothetical protein